MTTSSFNQESSLAQNSKQYAVDYYYTKTSNAHEHSGDMESAHAASVCILLYGPSHSQTDWFPDWLEV